MSMRTESDSWDLATSVGATATMVAAQRALASAAGLIDDPFAAPLVREVGIDVYTRLVNGEIPVTDDTEFDPVRMARGMAVRTRFYDTFFADATHSGIRQAVILAAGLDARAYRLPWPKGTVVYVTDVAGTTRVFRVTGGTLAPKNDPSTVQALAAAAASPGRPRLALITCGGGLDSAKHTYYDNYVLLADL